MIDCIVLGSFATNCYLYIDEKSGEALVIDCAVYGEQMRRFLEAHGVTKLRYVLLTHGHFDHVCGVKPLKDAFGGEICIHAEDADCLYDESKSLNSEVSFAEQTPCRADILLSDGDRLPFGNGEIRVMHTPGHTRGSVCYFTPEGMFSGDTLFFLSMGRTDMPGGSTKQLFASLRALGQIPGDMPVYPGHGEETSLLFEKRNNRYLRAK